MLRYGQDDAFGVAALAYLNDNNRNVEFQLHSDSDPVDGQPILVGMARYFENDVAFYEEVKLILSIAHGEVLDIGCGAGRFSLFLQNQMHVNVVGIDESYGAVQVCSARGMRGVRHLDVESLSIDKMSRFDTFLLLGYNLGIAGTPEGVQQLFQKLTPLAREKAVVLVDLLDKSLMARDNKNYQEIREVEYSQKIGRFPGQSRYRVQFGACDTGWFDWIQVSPHELEPMIAPTGWKLKLVIERRDKPGYYAAVIERND
jgi:SAM-dependent methyltransferase